MAGFFRSLEPPIVLEVTVIGQLEFSFGFMFCRF